MYELALFAGAGGGILGGKLRGWTTVCAVEIDEYARRVLLARQDDGCLEPFPIWDDVRTFDGKPWRGVVDIVTGGFPCQDISAAGKGAGIEGERSGLWSEFARIIREVGPRFVLVENSPMLTSRGLGRVLGDLAAMGYNARWGVLGAVDAGAPHKRDRIWIVAYSKCGRRWESTSHLDSEGESLRAPIGKEGASGVGSGGETVADSSRIQSGRKNKRAERERAGACGESIDVAEPDEQRLQTGGKGGSAGISPAESPDDGAAVAGGGDRTRGDWWLAEPAVGRVAHGVAHRVDRLRCLGNGQVPACVRLAWKILSKEGI